MKQELLHKFTFKFSLKLNSVMLIIKTKKIIYDYKFIFKENFEIFRLTITYLFNFFDLTIINKQIKAEKLSAASEQDLFLYKGMGASYLCIASKAGIDFPKAVGVATATYVQVLEGKHGSKVKVLGDKKLEREKLFAGAEFQIVTTAMQFCPDSIPKEVTKKVNNILKKNKK